MFAGRNVPRSFIGNDYSAIGPRFGLTYQPVSRTVIRTGYGIYSAGNRLQPLSAAGFNICASFASLDNGITPAFVLRDGFPQNFNKEPAFDPAFLNTQNASFLENSSAAMPRVQNWTFSIQRELSHDLLLDATYTGAHRTRQVASDLVITNQLDPKYLALGPLLVNDVYSAAAKAAGIQAPYAGFTGSVAQALRPFPQYRTLSSLAAKAGRSKYNAGSIGVRKRYSAGLTLNAHYTFSKALGDVDRSAQDNHNRSLERVVMESDVPHSLILNYSYRLPVGPGRPFANRRGVVGKLLEQWTIAGIHRYQSGNPITLSMSNTLGIFNGTLRPDLVVGQDPASGIGNGEFDPKVDRKVNQKAFAAPAAYRFGTAPPALPNLRTFPVLSEHISITKVTSLKEAFELAGYCQVFNALNRHRFANFDGNFSNRTFGMSRAVNLPRFIQLGLRLRF